MPPHEADGQLPHKMDELAKMWGFGADCSGESLSKNDVLRRCSIGDVAAISKLKSRLMQTFADSTSALGLRVVALLSALLEQQVPYCRTRDALPCATRSHALRQLPSSSQAAVSAALLKSQSGDGLDAGSFVSVGMWHRVRKLNARLHKRHGAAAVPAALLQAADAPASPSSSDSGSSDSEAEGVTALLPFKADTARAANGTPVVSARA